MRLLAVNYVYAVGFAVLAFSSVAGGRLRRPFLGGAFLRASASPRGGAIIALPLHGIGLLLVSLLQSLELISPLLPGIPLTLHAGLSSCGPADRFCWRLSFWFTRFCLRRHTALIAGSSAEPACPAAAITFIIRAISALAAVGSSRLTPYWFIAVVSI